METNLIIEELRTRAAFDWNPETMARYQEETGFYGELYVYDYMCKNRPELAAQIRARNPHNLQ